MSQEAYDIVIVGAGAAGCVVASYLAEHTDASIALIEAGDTDRDPFIHIPAGFAKILVHDRHVWKYETVPQHGTKRAYRSGKVLGGGSSINAMCYVRGQIRDYAAWQDAVGDTGKWSYEDLLPVFMAQEHNDTFHDDYNGESQIGVSRCSQRSEISGGAARSTLICVRTSPRAASPFSPARPSFASSSKTRGPLASSSWTTAWRGSRPARSCCRLAPSIAQRSSCTRASGQPTSCASTVSR